MYRARININVDVELPEGFDPTQQEQSGELFDKLACAALTKDPSDFYVNNVYVYVDEDDAL